MVIPMQSDDLPPHDPAAEASALGSAMLSVAALDAVFAITTPGDFYMPRHDVIAAAMLVLAAESKPVDVISVVNALGQRGELSRAGGADYLHQLCGSVVTPTNAGYHAGIVADLAVRRRLVDAGVRIAAAGRSSESETDLLVDSARRELDAVSGGRDAVTAEMLDVGMLATVEALGVPARAMPTPWRALNALLGGGLRGGWLYVVGARPSVGKTAVGLQLALSMARHGAVGMSSLEMSAPELHLRAMAQGAGVSFTALTSGNPMPQSELRKVAVWRSVTPLSVVIDDRAGVTVFDIRTFARNVQRRHDLVGLVVDYLQLISDRRDVSRVAQISEMTRAAKLLARDLNVPVVLLSQLNREVEHRTAKLPQLSDLRDSGSIEQDADVVLLLHRNTTPGEIGDELTMFVAKNRQGKTGRVNTRWDGEHVRALDFDAKPATYGDPELGWTNG
jgi:replicative DNA helicase